MATQYALERLRDFLEATEMAPEDRRRLETLLEEAKNGDKTALERIKQTAFERGYQPVPGKDVPLPPGPIMVCPEDPDHYRTFQREVGETLYCPVHRVPLIPGE